MVNETRNMTAIDSKADVHPTARIGSFVSIHTGVKIEPYAELGSNSVICADIRVGKYAVVKPGSVVSKSVPDYAIVEGNPAKIISYTQSISNDNLGPDYNDHGRKEIRASAVKGVALHSLKRVEDLRGNLVVAEFERDIPFRVRRYFMIYGVPNSEVRGEHAHKKCAQFLVCVKGSCATVVDDGQSRQEYSLDRPDIGLLLPPMTWGIQYKYSPESILLVFASESYDANDYIRDYDEFIRLVKNPS